MLYMEYMEYMQKPEYKQIQQELNNNHELLDELLSIFKEFHQSELCHIRINFHPILNSENMIMSLEYKINIRKRTIDLYNLSEKFKIVYINVNSAKNVDVFVKSNIF